MTSTCGILLSSAKMIPALIQSTATIIAQEGRTIVLERPGDPVPDGAGGFRPADPPTVAQPPLRLYYSGIAGVRFNPVEHYSEQGENMRVRAVIIGMPDDDIREGDRFTVDGFTFVINFMHPNREYQTKAEGALVSDGS